MNLQNLSRRRLLQLTPASAMLLPSCSSPPTLYYRLSALPGAAQNTAPKSIRIRNITVPAFLNQSNIAKASSAYQFAAYPNALWAEPLPAMLQTILTENLTQRLPQMTVTSASGAVGTAADLLVEINILRFDPDPTGNIVLIAQIALKTLPDSSFRLTRTIQTTATPATSDPAGTAAAMSTLWASIADQIALYAAR